MNEKWTSIALWLWKNISVIFEYPATWEEIKNSIIEDEKGVSEWFKTRIEIYLKLHFPEYLEFTNDILEYIIKRLKENINEMPNDLESSRGETVKESAEAFKKNYEEYYNQDEFGRLKESFSENLKDYYEEE